ncbi:hypothetical protein HU200_028987 [Digitaria exilis]|uniref:Uncharacterized protein n=1 Tax=Digitaria exilis TaxID=1010633 RepID=A0A835BRC5_9POAL|nr:hypothetical protein HU200_028987 [Digitaria exilis]
MSGGMNSASSMDGVAEGRSCSRHSAMPSSDLTPARGLSSAIDGEFRADGACRTERENRAMRKQHPQRDVESAVACFSLPGDQRTCTGQRGQRVSRACAGQSRRRKISASSILHRVPSSCCDGGGGWRREELEVMVVVGMVVSAAWPEIQFQIRGRPRSTLVGGRPTLGGGLTDPLPSPASFSLHRSSPQSDQILSLRCSSMEEVLWLEELVEDILLHLPLDHLPSLVHATTMSFVASSASTTTQPLMLIFLVNLRDGGSLEYVPYAIQLYRDEYDFVTRLTPTTPFCPIFPDIVDKYNRCTLDARHDHHGTLACPPARALVRLLVANLSSPSLLSFLLVAQLAHPTADLQYCHHST